MDGDDYTDNSSHDVFVKMEPGSRVEPVEHVEEVKEVKVDIKYEPTKKEDISNIEYVLDDNNEIKQNILKVEYCEILSVKTDPCLESSTDIITTEQSELTDDPQVVINCTTETNLTIQPKNISHGDVKQFKCSWCDKVFSQLSGLKQHKLSHGGIKPLKCVKCKKIFMTRADYERHYLTHTKVPQHYCTMCEKAFDTKMLLTQHKLTHKNQTKQAPADKFICPECGKCYSKKGLYQHSLIHSKIRKFQCLECSRSFTQSNNLAQHMLTHMGVKEFQCLVCKKFYSRKSTLDQHKIIHIKKQELKIYKSVSSIKPYKYNICTSYFNRESELKQHARTHEGDIGKTCDVCKKSFSSEELLDKHVLRHTKKSYSCQKCGHLFTHKGHLTMHLLSHGKEKRYKCPECPKTFLSKFQLNRHINYIYKSSNMPLLFEVVYSSNQLATLEMCT